MPFTLEQIENIANAALDFHMEKGVVTKQHLQNRPLLAALKAKQKTFPGGKGDITLRTRLTTSVHTQGYSQDDQVSYSNPANIKVAHYPWREIHTGIQVTLTELKTDGISVVNTNGTQVTEHSDREDTALANIFEDKLDEMSEGWAIDMNLDSWKDGTQDAKKFAGITSIVLEDPTSAVVVGGIDQSANALWRNRATLAIASSSSTWSQQPLTRTLNSEIRQLTRYGGGPTNYFAGSAFLDAVEAELRANGQYTNQGWSNTNGVDLGMADAKLKGKQLVYDPTLDDLGKSKYLYALDLNNIFLDVMDGEDMKKHNPARPEDRYVIFRAMTWTGGMVGRRRNSSGVYSIA